MNESIKFLIIVVSKSTVVNAGTCSLINNSFLPLCSTGQH
jgi:hypothetical protein